jgi:adenosylhomocysteine nucleosidase
MQSKESGPRPIAILAAVREEISPLERALGARRRVEVEGGSYLAGNLSGRPVALLRTGIGAHAARRAADWLIRTVGPGALVATGFAGALEEGLGLGDLVLAEEVYDPPAPEGEGPREWASDPDLLSAARSAVKDGLRARVGRIASSRSVLGAAREKRDFGERHQAMAVDMESSGVARAANVHDTRVVYVRAVIDEMDYDLPLDTSKLLTAEGEVRPLSLLSALLRRPAAFRGLAELRRRSLRAAESLARYVPALVAALPLE